MLIEFFFKKKKGNLKKNRIPNLPYSSLLLLSGYRKVVQGLSYTYGVAFSLPPLASFSLFILSRQRLLRKGY
jgi:hypothetical protein